MFNNFKTAFRSDAEALDGGFLLPTSLFADEMLRELIATCGGKSFNRGLYRVFSAHDVPHWNDVILGAFPSYSGRIVCFAIDWLGRVFALDSARLVEGRPGVVLFEPGTGEVLEIPCNLESFHESELIHYREEALAESFYLKWLESGGITPNISQCIGYKRPLFLGGSDTVDNLEVSDLDVYWTIATELIAKVKKLPPGTLIGKVTIQ